MKDKELIDLLKSSRVPERPESYWRNFAGKTVARLRQRPAPPQAAMSVSSQFLFAGWATAALAVVAAVLLIGLRSQQHSSPDNQLVEARKCFAELSALFPNQLRAIVFDHQGPHLLLAEKPVIPDSPPLYLKVCGARGCQEFVTFSGQQIPLNGENCEVLADGHGRVMLVGEHQVWQENSTGESMRVQAMPLQAVL